MQGEDHPADNSKIFDPDNTISTALIAQLASAISVDPKDLCQPFIRPGTIRGPDGSSITFFEKGLLDTGAQGSNFISEDLYSRPYTKEGELTPQLTPLLLLERPYDPGRISITEHTIAARPHKPLTTQWSMVRDHYVRTF